MNLRNSYLSVDQDTHIDKRTRRNRRRRKKKRRGGTQGGETRGRITTPKNGEEGENKGGALIAGEREEGEEITMTEQSKAVVMMTNSQKGVTWSKNDDSNRMGKTETPPTRPHHEDMRERRRIMPNICQQVLICLG